MPLAETLPAATAAQSSFPWGLMAMFFGILLLVLVESMLLFMFGRWTHAFTELKARFGGRKYVFFFEDSGYMDRKAIKDEAGILEDKQYGGFMINRKGTYIDRKTKLIVVPVDSSVGVSVDMRAAHLADSLSSVVKDQKAMYEFRQAVMSGQVPDDTVIDCVRDSIEVGAIKGMVEALIPHNITAKIEKMVALKVKNLGKVNPWTIVLIFVAILGAIIMGYVILKMVVGGGLGAGAAQAAGNVVGTVKPG